MPNVFYSTSFKNYPSFSLQIPSILFILLVSKRVMACYQLGQARLYGVVGRKSMYVGWSLVMKYIVPRPPAANSLEKNATQYKIFLKLILQPKFQLRGRRV